MGKITKKETVIFFILLGIISPIVKLAGVKMSFTISAISLAVLFVLVKLILDKARANNTQNLNIPNESMVINETKGVNKSKYTTVSKIILIGSIFSVISTVVTNKYFMTSFDIARIVGNVIGSIFLLSVLSLLFGLIPYFIFRKKLSNPKIVIFGIFFVVFGIIISFGAVMSRSEKEQDTKTGLMSNNESPELVEIKVDKSASNSEIIENMYRNTKYHFRIKFPEGWKIEVGDGIHIVQKASFENSTISIIIQKFDLGGNEGLSSIKDAGTSKEFIDTVIEGAKEKFSDVKIINSGETKIDNEPAYWVEYSVSSQVLDYQLKMTNLIYYLAKGDTMYSISSGTATDEYLKIKPLFTQTVSTFVLEN